MHQSLKRYKTGRNHQLLQQILIYPQIRNLKNEPAVMTMIITSFNFDHIAYCHINISLIQPLSENQNTMRTISINSIILLLSQSNNKMQLQDILLISMATIITVGYGYSLDMPQALEVPLRDEPYNFSSIEFNLLYIATSIPIIFTDIPLGIILDKFPLQITVVIIALTSFTAELLTAVLFDLRPTGYLYIVYVLRAIVGMAGSSAFTMQGFVIARYAAEHFEMLIGFSLCIPFIADSINVMLTPIIFDATQSISLPWYIASAVDFLAIVAALVISRIVINKEKRKKDEEQLNKSLTNENQPQQQEQQQFKASYLLQLPKLFWIVNLTILGNQIVVGLYTNLNDLIVNRFHIDYVTTGKFLLIPYLLGSVFSLILGKVLSLKPQTRRFTNLCSNLLITLTMAIIYFLPNVTADTPNAIHYVVVILFLVFFSIFSASIYTTMTSSVSLLVDKKRLGTAWGVVGTAIGLGQTLSPVINGLIEDDDNLQQSYQQLNLAYIFICLFPLALNFFIYYGPFSMIDNTFDGVHNKQPLPSETMITEKGEEKNQND